MSYYDTKSRGSKLTADEYNVLVNHVRPTATATVAKSEPADYVTTDYASDDACIQAAISYVNGLGGGGVLIREGLYTIKNTINLKNNLSIFGVGFATILKLDASVNKPIFSSDSAVDLSNIQISNLKLDGNKANNTDAADATYGNPNVIQLTNAVNIFYNKVVLSNLWVINGVHGNIAGQLIDSTISNIITENSNDNGLYISTSTNVTVVNVISKTNVAYGIAVKNTSYNVTVQNCITVSNGAAGIHVLKSFNLNISSNTSITDFIGILISETSRSIFDNNVIKSQTRCGIEAKHISTSSVSGNKVMGEATDIYYSIWVGSLGDGLATYNKIHDNICEGNLGIHLYKGYYISIHNNLSVICDKFIYISGVSNHINIQSNFGKGVDGITDDASTLNLIVKNNDLQYFSGTKLSVTGILIVSDNYGYNPVGPVGPPAVPATTVNYTNGYGYPCMVSIYGGTVTVIDLNDVVTGLTAGSFVIPPGGTINITYSAGPTWVWWGL